jgi:hypothetical protein
MIEIDIINESKYVFPWREERICISGALVLIVAKSILANHGNINWTMAYTISYCSIA